MPEALNVLEAWERGERGSGQNVLYVSKEEIAQDGDYKLTSEKYREDTDFLNSPWPVSLLSALEDEGTVELGRGQVISKTDLLATPGEYPVYSSSAQGNGEFGKYGRFMFNEELVTWSVDGGGRFFYRPEHKFSVTNVSGWLRILDKNKLNARYLFLVLDNQWRTKEFNYVAKAHPSVIRGMYKIPLPPIEEQDRIVSEIDKLTSEISRAIARVQELEIGVQEAISKVWDAN